jgi:hypothetical protein
MDGKEVIWFRVIERLSMTGAVYLLGLFAILYFGLKGTKFAIKGGVNAPGVTANIATSFSLTVLIFMTLVLYSWANMANPISVGEQTDRAPFKGIGGNETLVTGYFRQLFEIYAAQNNSQTVGYPDAEKLLNLSLKLDKLRENPNFEPDLFVKNLSFDTIANIIEDAFDAKNK